MTEAAKDFTPIQADYEFFVAQSTEAEADLAAHLEGLRSAGLAPGLVRMLDFGCGPGSFTARFLEGAGWNPDQVELTLVEPAADYRRQALTRLETRTSRPIAAWEEIPSHLAHPFDLALSNHAFYYVPDQRESLAQITRSLRPGGTFLASIAGKDNALVDFWFQAFPMIGRAVPYHTAEGLEKAIRALGLPYDRHDVQYELAFPDDEENRRKILRFLFGEHLDLFPRATTLAFFEPYKSAGQIAITTRSYQFCVRCPE